MEHQHWLNVGEAQREKKNTEVQPIHRIVAFSLKTNQDHCSEHFKMTIMMSRAYSHTGTHILTQYQRITNWYVYISVHRILRIKIPTNYQHHWKTLQEYGSLFKQCSHSQIDIPSYKLYLQNYNPCTNTAMYSLHFIFSTLWHHKFHRRMSLCMSMIIV